MDHHHLSGEINGSSKSNGFQPMDHLHLSGKINYSSKSNDFQMDHLHISGEINGSSKSNGFQPMDGELNGSFKSNGFQVMDHLHLSGEINGSSKSNGFQPMDGEINGLSKLNGFQLMDHLHESGKINSSIKSNGFQLMDDLHLFGEINSLSKSNGFQLMDHLHLSDEIYGSSKLNDFQIAAGSSFRDWAELLPELVDMILKRLHEFSDYLHFCGVCSRWRSVGLRDTSGHRQSLDLLKTSRNKLPMLLFQTGENNYDNRSLYSVSDGKTYKLQLPLPYRRRFLGSSHGWLICCEKNEVITLMNPLTNDIILLPDFSDERCQFRWRDISYPEYFLKKAILTADPHISPNDYAVILIYSSFCALAVYKSGDVNWKIMIDNTYMDIVCHNNNVYGLTYFGTLFLVDANSGTEEPILEDTDLEADMSYLIESQGELLLIRRTFEVENNFENEVLEGVVAEEEEGEEGDRPCRPRCIHSVTTEFIVSKLVREKGNAKFVEVNNIGEQALFVGENDSVSISTLEFPKCQPNSIYFTNEFYIHTMPYICGGLDEDSGIFNLEDKSFHFHHRLDMCEWYVNPPIWFVPKLAIKV